MNDSPGESLQSESVGSEHDRVGDSEGGRQIKPRSRLRTLLTLGFAIGLGLVAWQIHWESEHPAGTWARKIHRGDPDARIAAIHKLESLGAEDPSVAIPALTAALEDPDAGVRSASAMGLVTAIQRAGSAGASQQVVREAVEDLLRSLKDTQPEVRAAIVQSLWMIVITWSGQAGVIDQNQVVEVLIGAAGDPDIAVRQAAIRGLGGIGPRVLREPPPILVAAVEDESEKIRAAAAIAIVHFRRGLPGLIPSLLRSLEAARPEVRPKYLEILETIRAPRFPAEAITPLMEALASRDDEVRFLAVSSLATYKQAAEEAIPALIESLKSREPAKAAEKGGVQSSSRDSVIAIVELLAQIAPGSTMAHEAMDSLIKILKSGNDRQRATAAMALGMFPPDPWLKRLPEIVPAEPAPLIALGESAKDGDAKVRAAALRSLHDVGMKTNFTASPELSATLARALDDPSPEVRTQAAAAIAHSGPILDQFYPELIRHADHDPDKGVRDMCAAVVSLQSGPRQPQVTRAMIPVLIDALSTRESQLRHSVCRVLVDFGPDASSAIPALIHTLQQFTEKDVDNDESCDVIKALGDLAKGSPRTTEVVAMVAKCLKSGNAFVRSQAVSALGNFGPAAVPAIPELIRLLREAIASERLDLALELATALRQIEPTNTAAHEIIPMVIEILAPKRKDLHISAAKVAGLFGPAAAGAVPGLIAMLQRSIDRYARYGTRTAAAAALGQIAPGTPQEYQAVLALTDSLRTRKDLVQNSPEDDRVVIEALARFGPKAAAATDELRKLGVDVDAGVSEPARKALQMIEVPR